MILDTADKNCLAIFGTQMERGLTVVSMMVLNGGDISKDQNMMLKLLYNIRI